MDTELKNALAEINGRLDNMDERQDTRLKNALAEINGCLDNMDERQDTRLKNALAEINGRLDNIEERLEKIEACLGMMLYESGWYNTPPEVQARNLKRAKEAAAARLTPPRAPDSGAAA